MKFRKLTLAAVIVSMGLITAGTQVGGAAESDLSMFSAPSSSQVFESGFREVAKKSELPVVTGGACPLQTANPCQAVPVCPAAPCDCDPCDDPCDPCPAAPCDCDPCDPCDPCETGPACPILDPCPEKSKPTCGVCPNSACGELEKGIQAYAYPASIFSAGSTSLSAATPNWMRLSGNDGIQVSRNGCNLSQMPVISAGNCGCDFGVPMTGAAAPCGCDTIMPITGAAASLPCYNDPCAAGSDINGVGVSRNPMNFAGAQCPMTIKTQSSKEVLKKYYEPITVPSNVTGAAAPMMDVFPDVPDNFWASCDINKLTAKSVIAGYPDRTFKPNVPVSRAEFASLIAHGFNLQADTSCERSMFSDVPAYNWANDSIIKSVENGYMAGYPNNKFFPRKPVSRAEAMTTISKAFNCPMSECDADEILKGYKDGCDVQDWAKVGVAKALKQGVLEDSPHPDMIAPQKNASRADVAAMIAQSRIALGIDPAETTACDCEPTGQAAMVQKEQVVTVPTICIKVDDQLSAKNNRVGDRFVAKTLEPVTINGVNYPCNSKVHGRVVEVIRPSGKCQGAMKIALLDIQNGKCKTELPRQILSAEVQQQKTPNIVARLFEAPFSFTGQVLGTVGRTLGGALIATGNAAEQVVGSTGIAGGEILQGKFGASARSVGEAATALVMAPIDVTRTAVSGAAGIFNITSDEVAYLVNPKGMKIASINPNEKVTISFGCQGK